MGTNRFIIPSWLCVLAGFSGGKKKETLFKKKKDMYVKPLERNSI